MYRALLIGPLACAVIGGAVGVCLAMLYRQEPGERAHVYIEDSLPLLVSGTVVGCFVGVCISAACRRWPRVAPGLTVLVMTVLGAGIVAPLGWIAGDLGSPRMPRVGMAVGAALGAVGGLVSGGVQLLIDRLRRRAKPDDAAD
jgi:hypothetical protein